MKKKIINISSGALGYILPMLLNLFFTPLIVKNLDSESYGLQSLVTVIIGFLMVADMGLDIPVTKAVAEYKAQKNTIKLNELLNSALVIYLLIGAVGLVVLCIISPFLADYVFKVSPAYRQRTVNVFYLAGLGFVGSLFSMWGKSIFNGFLRYDISNGINVVSNLASLSMGTLFVVKGYGVEVYVLIRVVFIFLSGFAYLLAGKALLDEFKISLSLNKEIWTQLKTQIGYGFLLRISGIITSRLDQILIGIWIGIAAVGYYSIPLLMITSLSGLLNSMTHYLFPQMSELNAVGKNDELKGLFIKSSRYLGVLTFAIFMPFILFGGKFLHIWVGDEMANHSTQVFLFLLVAIIINSIFAGIVNLYLAAVGRLDLFTKYILLRSGSLGILMFFFIKPFGLSGVGFAMIAASILDGMFYFYVTFKLIKLNPLPLFYDLYPKLIAVFAIPGILLYYFYMKDISNLPTLFLGGTIYMILVILFAILFKVFNQEEKQMIGAFKARVFGNKY